jgi:hypothetical protein
LHLHCIPQSGSWVILLKSNKHFKGPLSPVPSTDRGGVGGNFSSPWPQKNWEPQKTLQTQHINHHPRTHRTLNLAALCPCTRHWTYHFFFDIQSYHIICPKNDIMSFISYREKNDMLSYHISFSYHFKKNCSKHTKKRS